MRPGGRGRRGAAAVAILAALAAAGGAGCRIAAVRPLEETAAPASGAAPSAASFDAVAFVDSIWRSEVLRSLDEAPDVGTTTAGPVDSGRRAVVVRGAGRVVSVDTRSRSGTATVELDGRPGSTVVLQIGPVLTGTAIRDALPALGFDRFVNQIQHADVGNELNARVERDVLSKLDRRALGDRRVSFRGMAPIEDGRPLTITPVILEVESTP
jgi:predicted lipoprotein